MKPSQKNITEEYKEKEDRIGAKHRYQQVLNQRRHDQEINKTVDVARKTEIKNGKETIRRIKV